MKIKDIIFWGSSIVVGGTIGLMIPLPNNEKVVKLYPVVVLSASSGPSSLQQTLRWRAAVTNDTILMIGDGGTNQLKVDFIYGNHDGIRELDNNWR